MPLSQSQRTILEKARNVGSGAQGVALDDAQCCALLGLLVRDLNVEAEFPELANDLPEMFDAQGPETLSLPGVNLRSAYEGVVSTIADADTYFASLATLYKARTKFHRIISEQAIPTVEQVGARGLLEYGMLPTTRLCALLFWRKWLFDIDNRAAQQTGYLYETIIAGAIGGTPVSSRRSPVHRASSPGKGRQIDCLREGHAYEIKIRVTIAASGQGRWAEELAFPEDCRTSGYVPVLVVLDSTPNRKLDELVEAFSGAGGTSYVGDQAWDHLAEQAGDTMSLFLEKYVRAPFEDLLNSEEASLPTLRLTMRPDRVDFEIEEYRYSVPRL